MFAVYGKSQNLANIAVAWSTSQGLGLRFSHKDLTLGYYYQLKFGTG